MAVNNSGKGVRRNVRREETKGGIVPKDVNPDYPLLKRDWIGRYVRLVREQRTCGGVIFDKGEILRVVSCWRGRLKLETIVRCEHCRRRQQVGIAGVSEKSLEILPIDFEPDPDSPISGL